MIHRGEVQMSFTITREKAGFIHIVHHGVLDMPTIHSLVEAIAQALKESGHRLVLSDYREAELKASITDLYGVPKLISECLQEMGLSSYHYKRALIVAAAVYNDFLFFETVSRNNMQSVKIFIDEDAAREWLFSSDPD